jgi:hypothetical protein
MGPPALLPIRRKVCCGFLSPLKCIALAGFEPATFGSSGKNTNHYTAKATMSFLNPRFKKREDSENWCEITFHLMLLVVGCEVLKPGIVFLKILRQSGFRGM